MSLIAFRPLGVTPDVLVFYSSVHYMGRFVLRVAQLSETSTSCELLQTFSFCFLFALTPKNANIIASTIVSNDCYGISCLRKRYTITILREKKHNS